MLLRQVAHYNYYVRNRNLGARLQHTMCRIFKADDTNAVLLIDASNAFNALNRAAALHNIRVLGPVIAVSAMNTYSLSTQLFFTVSKEITST